MRDKSLVVIQTPSIDLVFYKKAKEIKVRMSFPRDCDLWRLLPLQMKR